jgi:ribosome maturation factor RimP
MKGGFLNSALFFIGVLFLSAVREYSDIENRFSDLCKNVVESVGLSLYDLEYITPDQTLRLFVENSENKTATIPECSSVDRALTEHIEAANFIPEGFVLEVSSPGVYRGLRIANHFERCLGQRIMVMLNGKIEIPNVKKNTKRVIGKVSSVTEENVSIALEDEPSDLVVAIDFDKIKKANLEPKWEDIKE